MRILLVEDAVEVSAAMVDLLATRDHSADVVTNVADAVSLIRSDEFDLIVLDLNLPGGSGKELLSYCKTNRIDVPIFVVSARADLEDRVGLLESGADDYLVKPFDPPEFLARVRALLRRPKEKAPARTWLGSLTFDHDERRAFQHQTGLDIHLTPSERSVLGALMLKPGVGIRKETLTNLLYSLESDVQLSAVEVYVSRLRSKLDRSEAGVVIRAIRGFGYRIEAHEGRGS
ncbi:MAG TPA: DNA-binding response regulator [Alphaproteobacteria bacterium]|nr:DNA-binding response regulator [Alphaproteobacteria bacterium]